MKLSSSSSLFFMIFSLLLISNGTTEELFTLKPYHPTHQITTYTRPIKRMEVTSEASGNCLDIQAHIGEEVAPSGVIGRIETTFIELDLKGNSLARKLSKRRLQFQEKTHSRYTNLINKDSTAQATLDDVSLKLDMSRLELQQLHNQRNRLLELQKKYIITGPPGWRVIERFKEPGEYISMGETVATLGNFRKLLVSVALTYGELQSLRSLKEIPLYLPDIKATLSGKIHSISPDFDAQTRKITTEISFGAEDLPEQHTPRGGMRVHLTVTGDHQRDTYLVPSQALVNHFGTHYLMTAERKKTKVLLLGKSNDGQEAIISLNSFDKTQRFLSLPEAEGKK